MMNNNMCQLVMSSMSIYFKINLNNDEEDKCMRIGTIAN